MKKFITHLSLAAVVIAVACKKEEISTPVPGIPSPSGYTLDWSDEFDGQSINSGIWNFELGDGTAYGLPAGWGNDEKQIYTNSSENASLTIDEGNSVLAITAREVSPGQYTSAKLTTNGQKSMLFGRVDVRAKVPTGNGLWPAIWMLGENRGLVDWPGCGEIDIAEVLGNASSELYTTLHYTDGDNKHGELQNMETSPGALYSDAYHVYSIDWTPEKIVFMLDGTPIYEEMIEDDMKEFLRDFYLVMNVAVGGYWPGDPDVSTLFPSSMYVDYVRVYSKNGLTIPTPPVLDIDEETIGQPLDSNMANAAIKESFTAFGDLSIIAYGSGGEPLLRVSDTALDGTQSLVYAFPGTSWGGAYIQLDTPQDMSSYSTLKFSMIKPSDFYDAEVKLESPSTNATIFLKDYTPIVIGNGFVEYTVPLSDFTGLDLTNLSVAFALWNAVDSNQGYVAADVHVDNIHLN